MAAREAFLKESVLKKSRPGFVKVVWNFDGPFEDGSELKEVADSTFYIKAFFTKEALNDFYGSFEDSFNSPPDWSHALLLLNKFRVEFQSAFAPNNHEKRPRFVLMVDKFGLCDIHEGFFSKNQPQNLMADPEVQAKAQELENNLLYKPSQPGESQELTDVSMSLLLEVMGHSSIPDDTSAMTQGQPEVAVKALVSDSSGGRLTVVRTKQEALAKMCCLKYEDFDVTPQQQVKLDAIPEWKDDYIPPVPETSEECQCEASITSSVDVVFEGHTLQDEVCLNSNHPPPLPSQHPGEEVREEPDYGQIKRRPTGEAVSVFVRKQPDTNSVSISQDMTAGKTSAASTTEQRICKSVARANELLSGKQALGSSRKKQNADAPAVCELTPADKAASTKTRREQSVTSATASEEALAGKSAPTRTRNQPNTNSLSTGGQSDSVQAGTVGCKDTEGGKCDRQPSSSHEDPLTKPDSAGESCEMGSPQSDAFKSSGECSSVHQTSLSFTTSSASNIGEDISLDDPPSLPTNTASQSPGPPHSTEAEGSRASPQVQQQKQIQGNTTVSSVDTDLIKQAVILVDIPCEVGRTNPRNDQTSHEYTSQSEQGVSDLVKVARTAEGNHASIESQSRQKCAANCSAVSLLCLVENEVSSKTEIYPSSGFGVSQGFVPMGMTTQELVPCDSCWADNTQGNVVGGTAQFSHGFVPVNAQDLIPANEPFENNNAPQKVSPGGRQSVGDTACPVTVQVKKHYGESSCSPVTLSDNYGRSNMYPVTERSPAAASQAHHSKIHQTDTQNKHENTNIHLAEKSPEHYIYHSTHNSSTDGSQSPSILYLSPIQHSSNVDTRNVVSPRASEAQEPSPTKRKNDRLQTVPQNCRAYQTRSLSPPVKISKSSDAVHKKRPYSVKTNIILVDCSGSSDSEDDVDRELLRQASAQQSTKSQADISSGSSVETVVVPDSTQEDDAIVISDESSQREAGNKLAQIESHTEGELLNGIERPHTSKNTSDCVAFTKAAPTHTTGVSRKTNLGQSSSENLNHHERRTNQSYFMGDSNISTNMHTHPGPPKTKTYNSHCREKSQENVQDQSRESNRRSEDIQRSKQNQESVSMSDRDQHIPGRSADIEDPSEPADNRSASDVSEEYCVQRVFPGLKRALPHSSRHLPPQKRPREKKCTGVHSDLFTKNTPAVSEQSGYSTSKSSRSDHKRNVADIALSVENRQSSKNAGAHTQPLYRETNSHSVYQREEGTGVSGTSSVCKTNQSRHHAFVQRTNMSSDEDEDADKIVNIPRKQLIKSKHSPAITSGKQSLRDQHCSSGSAHTPNSVRAQTSNMKQKYNNERGSSGITLGHTISSSEHDRARNSAQSQAPTLQKCTNLRQTSNKTCNSRLQQPDTYDTELGTSETEARTSETEAGTSETEAGTSSRMGPSSNEMDVRIRSYVGAWLDFRARSEDPKQKRLRQLKLTRELLKKVEETLAQP